MEDDADRSGDGVAVDEDAVGGERHDIGRGGGKRAANRDHRLLLGKAADRVIHGFATGGGAAWAVDVEDHRLDLARLADPVEKVEHLLVVGDDAAYGDAGDMGQETAVAR